MNLNIKAHKLHFNVHKIEEVQRIKSVQDRKNQSFGCTARFKRRKKIEIYLSKRMNVADSLHTAYTSCNKSLSNRTLRKKKNRTEKNRI